MTTRTMWAPSARAVPPAWLTSRPRPAGGGPTLVTNPVEDTAFAALARSLVGDGASTPEELEAMLRLRYPNAVVRRRELASEAIEIWYVYRDGHWTPSAPATS